MLLLYRSIALGLGLALAACNDSKPQEGNIDRVEATADSADQAIISVDEDSGADVELIAEDDQLVEAPGNPYEVVVVSDQLGRLQPYSSCQALLAENPNLPSGNYPLLVQDQAGNEFEIQASCDMVTDEGGWTLIANYVHQGGTSPATQIRTQSLPLLNGDQLGLNEANTDYWGHGANQMVASLAPTEVRFQCRSSNHARVLHVKTSLNTCVNYFRTGLGSCINVSQNFTALGNHTAFLPGDQNQSEANFGDGMVIQDLIGRQNTRHWRIGSNGNQWECDDNPDNAANHTIHRVWVR